MNINIRIATLDDVETLIRLRLDFFAVELGPLSDTQAAAIRRQLLRYLPAGLTKGSFAALLAEQDGEIVSTAFLAINEKPANPSFPNGLTGTVMNVFTYPAYRRRGFAKAVMRALIARAKERGVSSLDISATSDSEPLCRSLGFHPSCYTAMEISLD